MAFKTSGSVAKQRLCVARRRVSSRPARSGQAAGRRAAGAAAAGTGQGTQEGGEEQGMVITGIVADDDHPASRRLLAQPPEKTREGRGVEGGADHAYEPTGAQADGAKAGHGLAGRRMLQDRIPDFRGYPQTAAHALLLEMAFIEAPQCDVGASRQTLEFLYLSRFSADRTGRPGDVACEAESPCAGAIAGIAARPDRPRTGGSG